MGPLTLAVPQGGFTNDLSPDMAAWFEAELDRIRSLGHRLQPVDATRIGTSVGLNRIIVAVEAHRLYAGDLDRLGEVGDPRVLSRIRFAETLSTAQIAEAYAERAQIIQHFEAVMEGHDALLAPTIPMMPPRIAEVEADFDRLNAAMLRNTSLVNLVDGCAVSLPSFWGGKPWSLLMIVGKKDADARILAIGETLQSKAA